MSFNKYKQGKWYKADFQVNKQKYFMATISAREVNVLGKLKMCIHSDAHQNLLSEPFHLVLYLTSWQSY